MILVLIRTWNKRNWTGQVTSSWSATVQQPLELLERREQTKEEEDKRSKINRRTRFKAESEYNKILRTGSSNNETDVKKKEPLIPGLTNRFLFFIVGFMAVTLITLSMGLIIHCELHHRL